MHWAWFLAGRMAAPLTGQSKESATTVALMRDIHVEVALAVEGRGHRP